ncbi:hypothetical protein [Andreprevotia sp. IGB-42]|uniref:hypothetical protein n=1 Tax=Andreprevotia sp. IGB-42 TaxID=2497473 RepID=UPI00135A42C1|nr:hypothetical protein [Andreprevotia sp. IGB-42]
MQPIWLQIAARIGVDAFLELWRTLDQCEELPRADNGMVFVKMRSYKSWIRAERDRYITALDQAGNTPAEIQRALRSNMRTELTIDHIKRVVKAHRPR